MTQINRQIHLVSRPTEGPELSNFALVEAPIPAPAKGEVLLKTLYLSLDPYMRARMYDGANYAASSPLGAPMVGTSLSKIIESKHPDFEKGEHVVANYGWQSFGISDGTGLIKVAPNLHPKSLALSALGLPGHTAYGALLRHGKPKKGETLLVSAAAGAVGSVAAQIGRIQGLNVVGITSGEDKCKYLMEELKLAAAVDRKSPDFEKNLKATCMNGVDIYFDNVAGEIAHTALDMMNDNGRYLVCGTIAVDRDAGYPKAADNFQKILATILVKRLTIRGFLFTEFADMVTDFHHDVSSWINSGDLQYKEHIVDGIDNAPTAFLQLFGGQKFGKLLVRVAQPD